MAENHQPFNMAGCSLTLSPFFSRPHVIVEASLLRRVLRVAAPSATGYTHHSPTTFFLSSFKGRLPFTTASQMKRRSKIFPPPHSAPVDTETREFIADPPTPELTAKKNLQNRNERTKYPNEHTLSHHSLQQHTHTHTHTHPPPTSFKFP